MNPEISIHDAITGTTVVREMTDEEYDQWLETCRDLASYAQDK